MRIISESMLVLVTHNYKNQSVLVETTACQNWLVFFRDSVGIIHRGP